MSIPYQQVVPKETAIAETKASNSKYISLNLIKEPLPNYHVDNIAFLEDKSDGSSITHALKVAPRVEKTVVFKEG